MSNKFRFSISMFLVLTFVLTTGVTAALAASENVNFLGARFIVGKGLLVTLKVSEDTDLTQAASLVVNGLQYNLECRVLETSGKFVVLGCVGGVSRASVGGEATIWFGPDSFTTTLKDPRPWCYSVFDYGGIGSPPWGQVGTTCQIHTANAGDVIPFFNPNYPTVPLWTYIYGEDSSIFDPSCGPAVPKLGNGYYFDC
jgi:hypothetical protein